MPSSFVAQVVAGQTAALALKKIKRSAVRKGMVLLDEGLHPKASWEFDADIAILTHSTTIQPRYQVSRNGDDSVLCMPRSRLVSHEEPYWRYIGLQSGTLSGLVVLYQGFDS